jgi:hypothetical protein
LSALRRRATTAKSTGASRSETRSGSYCPDAGDFIWINLNPTQGHEQQGRRPALVLSPRAYNERTGLCVACAITNQAKGPVRSPNPCRCRYRCGPGRSGPLPLLAGTRCRVHRVSAGQRARRDAREDRNADWDRVSDGGIRGHGAAAGSGGFETVGDSITGDRRTRTVAMGPRWPL